MNIGGADNDGWTGQRGARVEDQRRLHANTPHQNNARHSRAARSVPSSYVEIIPTRRRPTKETPPFSAGALRQSASTWRRRKPARPSNCEEGRRKTQAQTSWLAQEPGRPSGRSYSDLSFAFPTARGSDNHEPSGKCPCHHVRALDSASSTGYLNLDANDPYAAAHAYQYSYKFSRESRNRPLPSAPAQHVQRRPSRVSLSKTRSARRELLARERLWERRRGSSDLPE